MEDSGTRHAAADSPNEEGGKYQQEDTSAAAHVIQQNLYDYYQFKIFREVSLKQLFSLFNHKHTTCVRQELRPVYLGEETIPVPQRIQEIKFTREECGKPPESIK